MELAVHGNEIFFRSLELPVTIHYLKKSMIRKSATELHFIDSRGTMPTVEIDIDSLPEGLFGYSDLVGAVLLQLANATADLKATVYVYEGPSVNFGGYGHSAFFGVAGSRLVLPALYDAFCNAAGLKVRHGDQISQSQALCQYHVEGGRLWMPEEAHVWCSDVEEEERTVLDVEPGREDGEDGDTSEDEDQPALNAGMTEPGSDTELDEAGTSLGMRTQSPTRFRAARSDASVGSISRNIEEVYGLPEGAVALRGPDKKTLRSDATIRTLRKRWE